MTDKVNNGEYPDIDFDKWKTLLKENLKASKYFEVHCWNEEVEEINKILDYGNIVDSDWQYGKIIKGKVDNRLTEFILNIDKPSDNELYNKNTPFFLIFLDNGFCSEHYGSEIYITKK